MLILKYFKLLASTFSFWLILAGSILVVHAYLSISNAIPPKVASFLAASSSLVLLLVLVVVARSMNPIEVLRIGYVSVVRKVYNEIELALAMFLASAPITLPIILIVSISSWTAIPFMMLAAYLFLLTVVSERWVIPAVAYLCVLLTLGGTFLPPFILEGTVMVAAISPAFIIAKKVSQVLSRAVLIKGAGLTFHPASLLLPGALFILLSLVSHLISYDASYRNQSVVVINEYGAGIVNPMLEINPINFLILSALMYLVILLPYAILIGLRYVDLYTVHVRAMLGTPLRSRLAALALSTILATAYFRGIISTISEWLSLAPVEVSWFMLIYLPLIACVSQLLLPTSLGDSAGDLGTLSFVLFIAMVLSSNSFSENPILFIPLLAVTVALYDIDAKISVLRAGG